MPLIVTILVVLALLCFLVGTVQAQYPTGRPINWMSAGLALLTLAWVVGAR